MGGFVPTIDRPPLQELVRGDDPDYGWRVLVVCLLLNRAGRAQAERALEALLRRWPSPEALAAAPLWRIEDEVRCCGFQRGRAQKLALLSVQWARKRSTYASGARPVDDLPGVGPYAVDAFAIFVGGRLDADPEDAVLAEWVRVIRPAGGARAEDATYSPSVGKTRSPGSTTKGNAMSATAEQTSIQPKDLVEGQHVRINDEVQGLVKKADKKGGRLAIVEDDAGTLCRIRFRDIFRVEVVEPEQAEGDLLPDGREPEPAGPKFPTAQELAAEREAAAAARKTRTTPKAGTSRKYPEEITDAVRRAKKARGTTNGAPGAKQHVHVREVLERRLGRKPAAWSSLLEASEPGVDRSDKTAEKLLRDLASGKAPKDKLKALHPLAQSMSDPFCKGRNLASILVAWGEQLQVGADVAQVRGAK